MEHKILNCPCRKESDEGDKGADFDAWRENKLDGYRDISGKEKELVAPF